MKYVCMYVCMCLEQARAALGQLAMSVKSGRQPADRTLYVCMYASLMSGGALGYWFD